MPPEDGWPDIMNSYRNSRSVFSGPGRLFLCLMVIVTPDGVSDAKATNTKAEYCNKSFNRQHKRRPPFQYFRSKTDYVNGGAHCVRRTQVLRRPKRSVEHCPSGEGQPSTILVTPKDILSQLRGVFNKIRHHAGPTGGQESPAPVDNRIKKQVGS